MAGPRLLLLTLLLPTLVGCLHQSADDRESSAHPSDPLPGAVTSGTRPQRDGRTFPEGVIALTWDDGPDVHTLALADYLAHEHISATFFVVGEWGRGSSDPGFGAHVATSGYRRMPILQDLVALGHRVANHTVHHVLLGRSDPATVVRELTLAQRDLDPYIRDEVRFFRAPGGDWASGASRALDADPYVSQLLGPVRWDVDAKDWEASVWCESRRPGRECERGALGRLHVRPEVIARRYEAAIEATRRGIVLLHDRVGEVGSDYALEVARALVPRLVARGYVFAAPVLAFAPMRTRWTVASCEGFRLGDVNGDGRADACVQDHDRVTCALASVDGSEAGLPHTAFDAEHTGTWLLPADAAGFELANVTGTRVDVCAASHAGIACDGHLWSHELGDAREIHYADLDGDGRDDVCALVGQDVWCARSTGVAFEPAQLWVTGVETFALGDVSGDGRADVCAPSPSGGIGCAVSSRRLAPWSEEGAGHLQLADLNGDGRADFCISVGSGVRCGLSNGRAFTHTSAWVSDPVGLDGEGGLRAEWGRLGDINGDRRSDLCDCDGHEVRCAVAP